MGELEAYDKPMSFDIGLSDGNVVEASNMYDTSGNIGPSDGPGVTSPGGRPD